MMDSGTIRRMVMHHGADICGTAPVGDLRVLRKASICVMSILAANQ